VPVGASVLLVEPFFPEPSFVNPFFSDPFLGDPLKYAVRAWPV
jgi:hypothetical protein